MEKNSKNFNVVRVIMHNLQGKVDPTIRHYGKIYCIKDGSYATVACCTSCFCNKGNVEDELHRYYCSFGPPLWRASVNL